MTNRVGHRAGRALVVVLCKPPSSRHSKTRLRRDVGDYRAEVTYQRCLAGVVRAACGTGGAVQLAVHAGAPEEVVSAISDQLSPEYPCPPAHRQSGETFAARQAREIRLGVVAGFQPVTIVGSDLVGITPAHFAAAEQLATNGKVAVLAAPDGGYAAITTTQPLDLLTDVPMSCEATLQELIRVAATRGVQVCPVPAVSIPDIDTGQDFHLHAGGLILVS